MRKTDLGSIQKSILSSNRGMGLIAVLVAVAVVGILGAVVMTIFGTNSSLMFRKNTTRDADNMVRYIQGLLAQPRTCDFALRGGGSTTLVAWNYPAQVCGVPNLSPGTTCAEIPTIYVNPGGTGAAVALQENQVLSPDLKVTNIYIRQPMASLGETPPETGTINAFWDSATNAPCPGPASGTCAPKQFNTTTAKLVIRFDFTGTPMFGGGLRERSLDLRVGVDPATKEIRYCYQDSHVKAVNLGCGANTLYPGRSDCQKDLPTTGGSCQVMYFVDGFDALGQPICKCQISCADDTKNAASGAAATGNFGFSGGN